MKKMRGLFLGIIVAICAIAPFTIAYAEPAGPDQNETEKVKVHYENVRVIDSFYRPEDQTLDKGSSIDEPDDIAIGENFNGSIFEGWFADAEFKTEFTFPKVINEDTTIYAKFTKISDIEKKFKEILDAANLSLKSSLQEEYALDLLLDGQRDVLYDSIDDIEIPDFDIDGVTINDKDWYLTYTSIVNGEIDIEYSYNNIYDGHYSYRIPVKYAEADQHDAALDEAADPINNIVYSLEEYDEPISLDGLVDFTKIPEFGYEGRVFTKAEVREIYKNSNKKLTNANQFELNVLNENDINIDVNPDYSARMVSYNTLTKDDIIYAMLYSNMNTRYMVVVDPEVENNHAAYVENVKGKIKAYLESKGYTNIQFDLNYQHYGAAYTLEVFYGDVDHDEQEDYYRGDSFTIYMMKDENTYLLAKNLTVNYNDKNLFVYYAESYSEDKDEMSEEDVADIESMKVTLEGEGYDFFDGYDVYSWIPEGSKATLTFTVGTANNNRRFKVLHTLADGTIETFTGIVKDGQFSIDVTETSPFAVGLGEVVKATNNNPQTFDPIILSVLMLALSAIGLIGGSIYLTKSRLN